MSNILSRTIYSNCGEHMHTNWKNIRKGRSNCKIFQNFPCGYRPTNICSQLFILPENIQGMKRRRKEGGRGGGGACRAKIFTRWFFLIKDFFWKKTLTKRFSLTKTFFWHKEFFCKVKYLNAFPSRMFDKESDSEIIF